MPRRPFFESPATRRLWIRLTPTQHQALQEMARANQTTMTEAVRQAVNEYVADYGERAVFCPPQTTGQ